MPARGAEGAVVSLLKHLSVCGRLTRLLQAFPYSAHKTGTCSQSQDWHLLTVTRLAPAHSHKTGTCSQSQDWHLLTVTRLAPAHSHKTGTCSQSQDWHLRFPVPFFFLNSEMYIAQQSWSVGSRPGGKCEDFLLFLIKLRRK
uniref:Uncharacterized protein n=1 Tax=Branchiostoma floridae TaxID=7739 RepID=C3ZL35_BRAFL|eukprot:XP_002590706.1 hypothetical protein BRAFLDRAFT_89512 [Branchiostoma floridae]